MKSQTSLGKALRLLFAVGETTNPAGISVAELMQAAKVSRPTMPLPMVNILSGGLHASGGMDLQDFLAMPMRAESMSAGAGSTRGRAVGAGSG